MKIAFKHQKNAPRRCHRATWADRPSGEQPFDFVFQPSDLFRHILCQPPILAAMLGSTLGQGPQPVEG